MTRPQEAPTPAGFSADWLRLREPFDQAARDAGARALDLPGQLARWRGASKTETLGLLDLACGHGANLRALAPRIGGRQRWRLIDHDPDLLAAVPRALAHWSRHRGYQLTTPRGFDAADAAGACTIIGPDFQADVTRHRIDLARDLLSLDLAHTAVITASALLDLVSASWLQRLIQQARDAGASMLFALTVDGRTIWEPPDPDDAAVHALFGAHQHRDKGFGTALGPQAVEVALQQLASAGYQTITAKTDWLIDRAEADAMQRAMICGIATAAQEQAPAAQALVAAWRARREAAVGISRLQVGHADIIATWP